MTARAALRGIMPCSMRHWPSKFCWDALCLDPFPRPFFGGHASASVATSFQLRPCDVTSLVKVQTVGDAGDIIGAAVDDVAVAIAGRQHELPHPATCEKESAVGAVVITSSNAGNAVCHGPIR